MSEGKSNGVGAVSASGVRQWKRPQLIKSPFLRWALMSGSVIYLYFALTTIGLDFERIVAGIPRGIEFLKGFIWPDFWTRRSDIVIGVLESLSMTLVSTVIGVVLSIPIAIGGARNIAHPVVYGICRGIIALTRTFPEVMIAIFFVVVLGFGPFAGVVTLVIATVGFLGKLLAEDIENCSMEQIEAIRATGASMPKVIVFGLVPQIFPRLVGLSMYRLDINFRESAIIGVVGAGGIGATLNTTFSRYEFSSAAAILLVIIAIVLVAENLSSYIRQRLI
jgi:phosphonate transport system permease protein